MPGHRAAGRRRARGKGEGVLAPVELREIFLRAWERCGSPRRNRECWRRLLKRELRRAWGDV